MGDSDVFALDGPRRSSAAKLTVAVNSTAMLTMTLKCPISYVCVSPTKNLVRRVYELMTS